MGADSSPGWRLCFGEGAAHALSLGKADWERSGAGAPRRVHPTAPGTGQEEQLEFPTWGSLGAACPSQYHQYGWLV